MKKTRFVFDGDSIRSKFYRNPAEDSQASTFGDEVIKKQTEKLLQGPENDEHSEDEGRKIQLLGIYWIDSSGPWG
jgi:hypothetical protein